MGVGIYIWRYHEYSRISKLFSQTNGYIYINLQLLTYINEFLTFLYGFCCCFSTVKLIRLCRFNQRIYLFIQALKQAGKELISFAMMFSIIYFAFLCLFYLLFVSKISTCSSLLQTAQMIFEMTSLRFNTSELTAAASFLGPFCFSLFIFLVVFICLSMFLSIINQNFRQTRKNINKDNDQQIYSFMFDRFQRWIGLKKQSQEEIHEERDAVMRTQYFDPIERLPEKIDQLLDALNRVCLTLYPGTARRGESRRGGGIFENGRKGQTNVLKCIFPENRRNFEGDFLPKFEGNFRPKSE
jgi:hypothetical protein